jgi:hypothetical protein
MAVSETPTLISSEKTVAVAGTQEALSASQRVKGLTLIAKTGNTGQVYVGGSDVASTTNDGLAPGDSLIVPAVGWLDLSEVYVDVDVSGEGVDFYAVKG